MKSMEEKLPSADFFRVHRSYIVSINKVDFIQKNMLSIKGKQIPISEHYGEQFLKIINNNKIIE